ncbi:MAG TPA: amidohydrolase family protein [Stellaceae bacterium]|nr:amidohydrolase family protein [Stellaceae bacterium]
MLFTCRPPGTTIPGRFPGPAHARGKWFSVDIHCHVLCQTARDLVAAEKLPDARHRHDSPETAAATAEHQRRVLPQLLSLEQRLADMDTMGIDVQAVSPSPDQTYYGLPPDLAIAATRLVNDNIADIMGRHPDRFAGLGTVPFQAPELAVAELERLHKSLGLKGIEIAGSVQGEDYSDPKFRPIFAKVEELGLLMFMHPTGFTHTQRMGPWHLGNLIGNPLESTVAVHHLIFGGVLDRYPGLKLVVAHGGGFLPAYSGRIDHGAAARPDTCEHLRHEPTHYLKRLYFDTMVFTHHQLEYLVEQWGADHILMGTDYPFDMGDNDPLGFVDGAKNLSDGDKRAVLGHNAARLLNIPIKVHS